MYARRHSGTSDSRRCAPNFIANATSCADEAPEAVLPLHVDEKSKRCARAQTSEKDYTSARDLESLVHALPVAQQALDKAPLVASVRPDGARQE